MRQGRDSEPPAELHEQLPLPPSPETKRLEQHGAPEKELAAYNAADEAMLLARPFVKPPDLGETGYEFGPPIVFRPDQFTKRSIPSGAISREDRPPQHSVQSPNRSSRKHGSFKVSPVLTGRHVENSIRSEHLPPGAPDQTGAQRLSTTQTLAANTNNKPHTAADAKDIPLIAGELPFPDSSPKAFARPPIQAHPTHNEAQCTTYPSRGQTTAQNLAPPPTNVHERQDPRPRTSDFVEHHHGHNGTRYHQSPTSDQHVQPRKLEKEKGNRRIHPSAPSTGGSRAGLGGDTDGGRSRMVNRPLRELVGGNRPAKPSYRPRPESRSSNISKQRCAPNLHHHAELTLTASAGPRTDHWHQAQCNGNEGLTSAMNSLPDWPE